MKRALWKIFLFLCPAILAGQVLAASESAGLVPIFPRYTPPALHVPIPATPAEYGAMVQMHGRDYSALGAVCEAEVQVAAVAGGMFRLDLNTPCFRNMRVEVFWSNIQVSFLTSVTGVLEATLPAFETETDIRLMFENEVEIKTSVTQEQSTDFRRVALNWRGDQAFGLHALEFGADLYSSGHKWAGRPRFRDESYLIALGDARVVNAAFVEVYSIRKIQDQVGTVRLNVEVAVSPDNCGTSLTAKAIQTGADGELNVLPLKVMLPECDTGIEYLVFKSLLRDLAFVRN